MMEIKLTHESRLLLFTIVHRMSSLGISGLENESIVLDEVFAVANTLGKSNKLKFTMISNNSTIPDWLDAVNMSCKVIMSVRM